MRAALAFAILAFATPALAHHDAVSAAHPEQGIGFDQHLETPLPTGLRFIDERGEPTTLGAASAGKPLVLVMGYLECRDLCPMTLKGVTEAVDASGLEPRDYRAVFVSIDPRETPSTLARARRERIPGAERPAWTFLAGNGTSVDALADAIGFRYRYDAAHDAYAHPAGFVIATPDGRISRYFFGVRYEPGDVSRAIRDAAAGNSGSLAQRLVLLCYHFDPLTGRYTLTVLGALRAAIGVLLLAALAWAWRQRRRSRAR